MDPRVAAAGRAMVVGAYAAPRAPAAPLSIAQLFASVDTDRSGAIGHKELQRALSTGGWKPFALRTVILMINMFDNDRSGSISYPEFEKLMQYLVSWKQAFMAYDRDRSGTIAMSELNAALTSMGYRLDAVTFKRLVDTYDTDKSGSLKFDEYIQLFCELTLMTAEFAKLDTARRGVATVDYSTFVGVVMSVHH